MSDGPNRDEPTRGAAVDGRPRRPQVVGILNATPDSFSDGGAFADPADAVRHGLALFRAGADWVDVGGESTRPGAPLVDAAVERARVLPVIEGLVAEGVRVSIDTRKSQVAAAALAAGATMVNDVSGGRFDPAILGVAAAHDAFYVAMHMRGTPADMRSLAEYDDVAAEVVSELGASLEAARAAGIDGDRLIADPGFGFAKTAAQSIELFQRLRELGALDVPLFVGVSRKSMLGQLTGEDDPKRRLGASLAALLAAVDAGAAYVRVHDVADSVAALAVHTALRAVPAPAH